MLYLCILFVLQMLLLLYLCIIECVTDATCTTAAICVFYPTLDAAARITMIALAAWTFISLFVIKLAYYNKAASPE